MLLSVTATESAVVNAAPLVKFNVLCVKPELFANVPPRFKVPVPPIPPSLVEPFPAVNVELFVNVPSLSSTADADPLFINTAPSDMFNAPWVKFAPKVVVPVLTVVVPFPVTDLFIVFVFLYGFLLSKTGG